VPPKFITGDKIKLDPSSVDQRLILLCVFFTKTQEKVFFSRGHKILTQVVLITQLSSNSGISVWRNQCVTVQWRLMRGPIYRLCVKTGKVSWMTHVVIVCEENKLWWC